LEELAIEDQLRLSALDVSDLNLLRLSISDCRNPKQLIGLERQTRLEHFSLHGARANGADLGSSLVAASGQRQALTPE
jgi:hypothetical protein